LVQLGGVGRTGPPTRHGIDTAEPPASVWRNHLSPIDTYMKTGATYMKTGGLRI
jgi:hypothetical protein